MKNLKKMAAILAATAISATSLASFSLSVSALDATDEPPYTAWLFFQAGGDMKKNSDADKGTADYDPDENNISGTEATITGDGEYSVDVTMGTGSETIECMSLQTNINGYTYITDGQDILKDGVKIEITSIEVKRADGITSEIPYNGPSEKAYGTDNDSVALRMNIYNTLGERNDVKDIDNKPTGGLMGGDTVVVNFKVSNMVKPVNYGDVDGDGAYTIDDAFMTLKEYATLQAGGDKTFDDAVKQRADVDGDGSITNNDAFLILQFYSRLNAGEKITAKDLFPAAK